MAIWNRRPAEGLIHHSEQGCQSPSLALGGAAVRLASPRNGLGRRLRQRHGRAPVRHPGGRAAGRPPLPDPDPGPDGRLGLPGRLLQPPAAAPPLGQLSPADYERSHQPDHTSAQP
jgi:hypothetical protein